MALSYEVGLTVCTAALAVVRILRWWHSSSCSRDARGMQRYALGLSAVQPEHLDDMPAGSPPANGTGAGGLR